MNTFHDLFQQPTRRVGNEFPPDRRRELFPGFVERSPMVHLWTNLSTATPGPLLRIGVATWSGYDMALLDLIEQVPTLGVYIEVFDVDSVPPDELPRLIPGTDYLQPPFVTYMVDGKVIESASGFAARQLAAHVCGLDTTAVEERLKAV